MAKKIGAEKFSYFETKIINNLKNSKGFIKPYGIMFIIFYFIKLKFSYDELNTFA